MNTTDLIKKASEQGIVGFKKNNRGYWEAFDNNEKMSSVYLEECYEHALADCADTWVEEDTDEVGDVVYKQMVKKHSGAVEQWASDFDSKDDLMKKIASYSHNCECGNCPSIILLDEIEELCEDNDALTQELLETL